MVKLARELPSWPVRVKSVAVASRLLLVRQSKSSRTRVSSVPSTSTQRASLALGAVEPLRVVKIEPREVWDCQAQLASSRSRTRLRRTSSKGSELKQGTTWDSRPPSICSRPCQS